MSSKLKRLTTAEPNTAEEYYVLGRGHFGASMARRPETDGHDVRFVDDTHDPEDVDLTLDGGSDDGGLTLRTSECHGAPTFITNENGRLRTRFAIY